MDYEFSRMSQEQAEDIAYNWHYEGDYSFYDIEADQEDLAEFLNPKERGNSYYVVTNDNGTVGFFNLNKAKDNTIDIGLGMRPDLTGSGYGLDFLKAGLEFAQLKYAPTKITLSVATFNKRAIRVYDKAGFQPIDTFMQNTNGSYFEFLKMNYECKSL